MNLVAQSDVSSIMAKVDEPLAGLINGFMFGVRKKLHGDESLSCAAMRSAGVDLSRVVYHP